MLLTGQSQCWRSGSDFPRNSLDQRRISMSQTVLGPKTTLPTVVRMSYVVEAAKNLGLQAT